MIIRITASRDEGLPSLTSHRVEIMVGDVVVASGSCTEGISGLSAKECVEEAARFACQNLRDLSQKAYFKLRDMGIHQ